jgi:hypothetical protein
VGEREQFSVRVYYDDGQCQCVRRFVSAQEACRAFQHYTSGLAARLVPTVRVIIIDSSDCMVREWQFETAQAIAATMIRGRISLSLAAGS